jgi:hypothetical protein
MDFVTERRIFRISCYSPLQFSAEQYLYTYSLLKKFIFLKAEFSSHSQKSLWILDSIFTFLNRIKVCILVYTGRNSVRQELKCCMF